MRKSFLLIASFALLKMQAQHVCSTSKIASANYSSVVATAHTNLENKYDVKFHHLNLNVERTSKAVSGNVRTIATVSATSLDSFAFELHSALIIDSMRINGVARIAVRNGNEVRVKLVSTLNLGATIDATIYYHGTPPTVNGAAIGDGFNNRTSPSWGNQITWSLSQPYSAYEWWPCKQQLQDKIDSTYTFITTDSTNKAGSNGILTNVVTIGNKKRYEWKNIEPMNYYLVSVAVGKYVDYRFYAHPVGAPDSVLVQNYIYDNPATLTNFKTEIDRTDEFIEHFSTLFGTYPFWRQKYGHCMAPLGGGMEHQTMTTQGSFSFTLTAHELGHQWWGDNVTCRTWNDIFVNEGLASYCEQLALEQFDPAQAAPNMLSVHNSVMGSAGGSVYNPDTTDVNRIFDSRLSYDKGSAIMHSLRFVVNDDNLFFTALKNYQTLYARGNASIDDFKTSIENSTGLNLTQFFAQWIYGEGYPSFTVKWNKVGNNFMLKNTETVSMGSITPIFKTPIEYKLTRSIGDTIIKVDQNNLVEYYTIPGVLGTVTAVSVDPNNWILNKVISVTQDATLTNIGVNEFSQVADMISVYPNPASAKLFVELPTENNFKLTVFDLQGNVVTNEFNKFGLTTLSLNEFAQGVYFLQVQNEDGVVIKNIKFVKS